EIEWILKMQDTDSGGFYPRIQSDDDENVTSRIIRNQNGCTTDDTACAAAILAHAYLMYMEYDSDFAQNCLDAAKDAWVFLQNNPRDIVSPSGPYNVDDDRADRLWAAASLYRVTGEEIYNTYFKENYKSFAKRFEDPDEYAHTWGDMWLTAFLSYLKADNKDAEAKSWIDAKFDIWLDNVLSRAESNPWQNAIVPGNYFWGINMQVMNVPMDAIIGSKLLDKYTDRVSKLGFSSLSWLLGANPLRFSFVSGYGENSVKGIYSNIYNSDGKEGIPNGYMPGGPNAYEGAGLSRFAAKCYTKSTGDWVANEHTVYWNSALVFMSAYASQKAGSIVEPTPKPTEKPTPNPTPTTPNEGTNEVDVNINTGSGRRAISPYIYGSNQDVEATLTAKRFGGNRTTAYNWETNFSNAGNDWVHSSDTWLCEDAGVPKGRWSEPGAVVTTFHDKALENNVDYSIITLQAAGYVSADADGAVSEEEKAPSPRWKEVVFEKGAPFSLTPDTDDDYVYMDEFVNFLVNKYGNASEPTGVKGYSVDNEPALWTSTHSRMHPEKVTCEEIINKTVDLSKAVKNVDPYAEIFGPALYGFAAFESLQSAPDWDEKEEDYRWFIDYYLDSMKKAADRENRRLLDVLDVHWYPEAQGGGARICFGEDQRNIECNKARLQAARTLWDPTYYENSWIGDHKRDSLPILPSLFDSIESYYPGTKLAITEYDYGAGKHITGGIAQADVLGIFGEYGVYLATYWGEPSNNFTASGINLYTNYDGQGGTFGDTSVECEVSDNELGSAYASIIGEDDGKLHIIVLNKNYDESTTFNFKIDSETNYKTGEVWAFDRGSSNITKRMPVAGISENAFTYTLPALTACHIILDTEQSFIYGDIDNNGAVDAVDLVLLKRYLFGYISNINEEAADICLDGSIDSNDYALLKKWLLKNIRQLPSIPENNKPVANFTISKAEATTDDTIQFDASTSVDPDQNIAFYVWDFGNGLEATGKLVGFKYMNPGEYTVKLTVTDTRGASDTLTKTVAVISATGDNSKFSFEDGTDGGFATDGTETSTIANSNVRAFRGLSSLRWDINSSGEGEALLIMDGDNMVAPGETIVYRIWVPEDAQIGAIQPYIMPHTSDWEESFWNSTWGGYSSLEKEAWNEFTLTLPEDTDPSLPQQLGIQIMTSGEGEFTVFVDSIDW
ncbi:MAG: PKD domain-containing protein, partial [Clostridiaceae bacterium]|nr:PKD domain-containing protein [Clostridiaceae bacterium]